MIPLRSAAWLAGDDEVALAHRVALASAGVPVARGQPVIGIANSASQLNPCNLPVRDLVGPVRDGIEAAGGVGVEFPTISLGEDLMKPSAMLYRNLLAIEIEEMIRANPLDGMTDARMSGTSFGTVVLHVAPEAAVGGPLALVRDGDMITLDIPTGNPGIGKSHIGKCDIGISETEMSRRRAEWVAPGAPHLRGWPALYASHVTQAPQGCDLDFLRAPTAAHRSFIEPVVGRS